MTAQQIFNEWKINRTAPVAIQYYVVKDYSGLDTLNTVPVDYQDEMGSIKTINNTMEKDGFRFFTNTEEGQAWMRENEKELKRSFIWAFAPVWGFTKDQAIEIINDI